MEVPHAKRQHKSRPDVQARNAQQSLVSVDTVEMPWDPDGPSDNIPAGLLRDPPDIQDGDAEIDDGDEEEVHLITLAIRFLNNLFVMVLYVFPRQAPL